MCKDNCQALTYAENVKQHSILNNEILGMCVFRENLYVATTQSIYVKGRGDEFIKLKIGE